MTGMHWHSRALLILGAAALAGAGIWLATAKDNASDGGPSAQKGQISTIILAEDGFAPAEITIRRGDTVTFRTTLGKPFWPASDFHPTHGIYPAFDPERPIPPEESWSFTFDKAGSWRYHDHLSPQYHGVIHVEE